jgi:hypothetical protein
MCSYRYSHVQCSRMVSLLYSPPYMYIWLGFRLLQCRLPRLVLTFPSVCLPLVLQASTSTKRHRGQFASASDRPSITRSLSRFRQACSSISLSLLGSDPPSFSLSVDRLVALHRPRVCKLKFVNDILHLSPADGSVILRKRCTVFVEKKNDQGRATMNPLHFGNKLL